MRAAGVERDHDFEMRVSAIKLRDLLTHTANLCLHGGGALGHAARRSIWPAPPERAPFLTR